MPRRKAIQQISMPNISTPMGFAGGVAQGLISTLPYMQLPQARIQALEEQLQKAVEQQLNVRTALAKERSDILQQNILIKPSTPEKSMPLLSNMVGRYVEPISLEEQRRFLETGEISPDVVAIPRTALLGYTQLAGRMAALSSKDFETMLDAAKFATSQIDRAIKSVNDIYGGMIVLPQDEILRVQAIQDLEEKRKQILNLLNMYYPPIFSVFVEQQTTTQQPTQQPVKRQTERINIYSK
ncbi:MAG: hypothetical protein ABDH23_07395 [Endomicrobiia bacterium]